MEVHEETLYVIHIAH